MMILKKAKVDAIADFFKDLRTEQEPYVFARMGWLLMEVGDWKGTKEDMVTLVKKFLTKEKHQDFFENLLILGRPSENLLPPSC